ncbi:hypothetical protein [Clostridium gasigenes]|uniref:hypothetical protein n=1 Tax=Clostridium gasigenes TaxID=94869 RepID=UPI001C0CD37A|nr:hypothetical protein [Clostridium gasigenes]MBU3104582.1 hypothetical protein [Clostridium gasigenes]
MDKPSNISIKKYGIGTSALIISIFSIMFSFTYIAGKYIGDHILNILGISLPIKIISIILFFIAVFIGHKYKNDYLAKTGRNLSIACIFMISILTLTCTQF